MLPNRCVRPGAGRLDLSRCWRVSRASNAEPGSHGYFRRQAAGPVDEDPGAGTATSNCDSSSASSTTFSRKAPTLGSLINPHRFLGGGMLDTRGMDASCADLRPRLPRTPGPRREARVGHRRRVWRAAELLAGRYSLVVTNVPYLGRGKQDDILKEHLENHYPLRQGRPGHGVLLRCLEFCPQGGSTHWSRRRTGCS